VHRCGWQAGEAGVLRSNGAVGRRRQYGDMFGTRVVQVSSKQAASLTWDVGTTVTSASCAVLSVSTATMQARLGPLDKVRVGAPPPPPLRPAAMCRTPGVRGDAKSSASVTTSHRSAPCSDSFVANPTLVVWHGLIGR
jgi:hypothetical protein